LQHGDQLQLKIVKKGASFMKLNSMATLLISLTPYLCVGQDQPTQLPVKPPRPTQPHGVAQLHLFVWPVPRTLEQLTDLSSLIVEGVVKTTLPSRGVRDLIETDSVVTITQTLKGSIEGSAIVISQSGGTIGDLTVKPTQYALVQQGERYILCLKADERTTVPDVQGLKRYTVVGAWTGLLFFGSDDTLHTSPEFSDAVRKQYESVSISGMIDLLRQAMVPTKMPVPPPFPGILK
jgi:hypothetical protein